MVFRTDQEKNKWNAIQKAGEVPIAAILEGRALPADIKALSALVAKQYSLAGKIFDEGIASAEATADTIVDKLNQDRIALGKAPLTSKAQDRLFKQTFQKVLSASADDILGSVKDYMDEKFKEQEANQKDVLDDAFDRVRRLAQTAPSPSNKSYDVWSKRTVGTQSVDGKQPISSAFLSKIKALGGEVIHMRDELMAGSKASVSLKNLLTTNNPRPSDTGKTSILGNLKDTLFSTEDAKTLSLKSNGETASTKDKKGVVNTLITKALAANTKLKNAANDAWSKVKKARGGKSYDEDEDDEKKSTNWLRKVRDMLGSKKRSSKGSGMATGTKLALGGGILAAIISALMNPELVDAIATGIKKTLNFETVSNFVADTWKSIKDKGAEIFDSLLEKVKNFFGINKNSAELKKAIPTTAADRSVIAASVSKESAIPKGVSSADAQQAIPGIEDHIAHFKRRITMLEAQDAKDPSDQTKVALSHARQGLQIYQNQLASYKGVVSSSPAPTKMQSFEAAMKPVGKAAEAGASVLMPGLTQGVDFVSKLTSQLFGLGTTQGKTSVGGASKPTSIMANSSVTIPPVAGASKTSLIPESPPVYKDGVFKERENTGIPTLPAGVLGSPTSNPVSISTFGFNSGDDTMNLLNMRAIQ